jgi:ubiquinone/menaquinone biosynthesis C-methylase UbiE
MRSKSRKWQRLHSGERSFEQHARPAVIKAALSRYMFAIPYCEGRHVLDIGCGSAFGLKHLATAARRVAGLDYSSETCILAARSLREKRIHLVSGDALQIPFATNSFDVVTAFEMLEHLERPRKFISEIKRVLSPNGVFILSTPNQPVYSPRGTWLDYHVREYNLSELRDLLSPFFNELKLFGQAHLSKDAQLDYNSLNRFFYPIKRRLDPHGIVLNRLRAAYVYLRWGETREACSIEHFPVRSHDIERLPILIAVCKNKMRVL